MALATLLQLRTRARQLADQVNSSAVSDSELTDMVEEGKAELYELIVDTHDDYAVTSSTVSLVAGTGAYALPADFLKERAVDLVSGGQSLTIPPFEFRERNRYSFMSGIGPQGAGYRYSVIGANIRFIPTPSASGTATLWYVPQVAAFSGDADTLPVSMARGWDRYIVVYAAMRMLMKEESDVSVHQTELARIGGRIVANAATRRAGDPGRIVDVRYAPETFWRAR